MRSSDLLTEFRRFLDSQRLKPDRLDSSTAIAAMVTFYEQHRVDDVDLEELGDMLLFQYGTVDWHDGRGEAFEYNVTRQVVTPLTPGQDDDDAFWQLQLTLRYPPTEAMRSLGMNNRWCQHPADAPGFEDYIRGTEAAQQVRGLAPIRVDLNYQPAG
jgi:hypothetical protein